MFDYTKAAEFLKKCQVNDDSEIRGTVCPWVLNEGAPAREDLHDTLQAVYIWSREENIDTCRKNAEFALEYVKRKFDWFSKSEEPLKSYDAVYHVLAINQYLKHAEDEELRRIEEYSRKYLTEFFMNNPEHEAREYSNAYWKASLLFLALKFMGEDTAFLANWVRKDTKLVKPENEPVHRGRGYQHPHDFCSTFGTRLYAINLMLPDFDFSTLNEVIPDGFVSRSIDPTSFNAFVLYGLCSLIPDKEDYDRNKVESVKSEIFNTLEEKFVDGGIKRGDYVDLRESWSTFFVYFAELLREGKSIL